MTGSSQVLQSGAVTDGNISIGSIITKPSLTSSRLYSDTTCNGDDNASNLFHETLPLLSDSRINAITDLSKSEVATDQVSCYG